MKKLLALILALAMILALSACVAEPIDTNPTADPKETNGTTPETNDGSEPSEPKNDPTEPETDPIYLVASYETSMGNLTVFFDSYHMEFSYNEDLTGGNITMTANGITEHGTFTCDDQYNITNIHIHNEKENQSLVFDMRFDDSHRLLSAVITLSNAEASELLYSVEYAYNARGQRTRYVSTFPRHDITSTYLNTYDDNGMLLEEATIVKSNGTESYTKNIWCYDDNGILTGLNVCDADGNALGTLEFTHETVDGMVICSTEMDGTTMRIGFDQWGNTVLVEMSAGGMIINKNESTYDENGNLLITSTTTPQYSNLTEHTYDEAGHLISTVQTINGERGETTTTYITVEP